MGKYLIIFTRSIAYKLRQQGFKCVGTEPNYKQPQFDIYIFENSLEIRKAFAEITGCVATAFTDFIKEEVKAPATTKKIFNKKVADDLVDAGFEIAETIPNVDVPNLNVYIFKKTKAFELYLNDYFSKKGYKKPSER